MSTSLRCFVGIHREFLVEGFPLNSSNPHIGGLECERCKRARCVNLMHRPTMNQSVQLAFAQAREWMENRTGQRVIGTFVHYR